MARNKKSGCGCGGCLIKLLIAVLIVAVVLGVAAAVILNMTPEQLGIADVDINGTTLREMGLADVKIKEVLKFVKDILNADPDGIVQNPYSPETEKTTSENNLQSAVNVGSSASGGIVYSDILKDKIVYDEKYFYEYRDTTLAYIFQSILDEGEAAVSESNGAIDFLRDINGKVEEISIYASGAGYELRTVFSVDVSEFKSEIESLIPLKIVRIPDRIYLVSYSSVGADSDGRLVTDGRAIRINDVESVVADAIFKVLSDAADESVDTDEDLGDENTVNDLIGEGFAAVVANLGKVGVAEFDPETRIVTGEIALGAGGIKNHALTLITYTSSDVDVSGGAEQ